MYDRNKVLIVGDSFSAPVDGNYLERTFKNFPNLRVENLSLMGASFWRQFDILQKYEQWDRTKYCLVFWSDPMRIYMKWKKKFDPKQSPVGIDVRFDNRKWNEKYIFSKGVSQTRRVQKLVEDLIKYEGMDPEMEYIKAFFCQSYMNNIFYKKYKDVTFINFDGFDWKRGVTSSGGFYWKRDGSGRGLDIDKFKFEGPNVYDSNRSLITVQTELRGGNNHFNEEQHKIFSEILTELIDNVENGKKCSKIINLDHLMKN